MGCGLSDEEIPLVARFVGSSAFEKKRSLSMSVPWQSRCDVFFGL